MGCKDAVVEYNLGLVKVEPYTYYQGGEGADICHQVSDINRVILMLTKSSQTSFIRASLIRMPHNPNTVPSNLFYHFLFAMIQQSECFTIRTHYNGHQTVRINEV